MSNPALVGVTPAPITAIPVGPPRSQFQDGRQGTLWWAVPGLVGQGWYIDTISVSRPVAAPSKANPYDGAGLLAVLVQSAPTQAVRTKAEQALIALVGEAQRPIVEQANMYADPTWNAAIYQVLDGVDPVNIITNFTAQGSTPVFSLDQLRQAVATANGL